MSDVSVKPTINRVVVVGVDRPTRRHGGKEEGNRHWCRRFLGGYGYGQVRGLGFIVFRRMSRRAFPHSRVPSPPAHPWVTGTLRERQRLNLSPLDSAFPLPHELHGGIFIIYLWVPAA